MTLWPALALVALQAGGTIQHDSFPVTVEISGAPVSAAPQVAVTIRFDREMPAALDVARLSRVGERWHLAAIAQQRLALGARTIRITGAAGVDTMLVIRVPGQPGYVLDGPFRWPSQPSTYDIPARWRRTVRGRWLRNGSTAPVWIDAADIAVREAWPRCAWHGDRDWECIGVPLDSAGVVVTQARGQIAYGVAPPVVGADGVQSVSPATAVWGRLLRVDEGPAGPALAARGKRPEPRARALRTALPVHRPQSARLGAAVDPGVRIDRVGPRAFWVTGSDPATDSWIEVSAEGLAPARIPAPDLVSTPIDLPFSVVLDRALAITGRVSAPGGVPVGGADLMLSRFVREPSDDGSRAAQRMMVATGKSTEAGEFRFDGLAMDRYELVVLDARLGRAEVRAQPDAQPIEIVLKKQPRAVGRVTRDGVPAAGIRVALLPELAAFARSADPTEVIGGEVETDADGRFSVALPAKGTSELRVGAEGTGVRRVPLTAAATAPSVIDVGTIDLAALPPVALVLEASEGCELRLIGPVGRTGMTLIQAVRIGPSMFEAPLPEPGRWMVNAKCGGEVRTVHPSLIEVPGGANPVSIRLSWPPRLP